MQHRAHSTRRQVLNFGAVAAISIAAAGVLAQVDDASRGVDAALTGWVAAFNSAEPTGRFFTRDATLVRGNGVFVGAERIEEMERREAQAGLRLALKVQRVEALGPDGAWALGAYEVTVPGKDGAAPQLIPGVSVHVLQREGQAWRIRASSFTRVATPAARPAAGSN